MRGMAGGNATWNDALGTMADQRQPIAFESFFLDEQQRLFRILCVITGSRQEAEDIAQDAFAGLWERWSSVSAMENPAGYLHRTAINLFRNRYRRALLAARRTVSPPIEDDPYQAVDERQVALQVLRSMAPRQRAAIVLTEMLDYTAEEAARMLGIRAATVRALHFQARSALKEHRETTDA
jgi:RNA polymerase sigma factor (sigma-70 family)